jgi:hypothetical protein
MMNYSVIANYDDCVITVETNSANTAISALLDHAERGAAVDVMDNYTGEVYVTANNGEPYITEEWVMMILGYLLTLA